VDGFEDRLSASLGAPRPTVISILCEREGETQESFQSRAKRAIRARAFPICVYDPDRDSRFVLCFDLCGNPSVDSPWTTETLSGLDFDGNPVEMNEPFTVAHFAAAEPEFATDFSAPPESADSLVQLTDYLALSHRQRLGKIPFIRVAEEDGRLARKVVSTELAGQCAERLHLWRTLQEIAGVDNPYLDRQRAALDKELSGQQAEQLASLRNDLEQDAAERERAAVASTVRKLVARLTGVEPRGN
jgi:pyruvate-ferredoxin/flavodoxin oxidoreductase